MRISIFLSLCLFLAGTPAFAQNSVSATAYKDSSPLMRRNLDKTDKAIAAINEYATRDPSKKMRKRPQADPALQNPLAAKSFDGTSSMLSKSSSMGKRYSYNEKTDTSAYQSSRKFLGIKNPWFGKKIYEADKSDTWNKTDLLDQGRKYSTKSAKSKAAFDADKSMTSRQARTQTFIPDGGAQGAMNKLTDTMKKEMTVEEVRELLNKN